MLIETKNLKQHPNEQKKRWFSDVFFDLIVWYGKQNEIDGFELCYGKPYKERVLVWKSPELFQHMKVDDGEQKPFRHKMTPIYVPDGEFRKSEVLDRFLTASEDLEKSIRQLVTDKLSVCELKE